MEMCPDFPLDPPENPPLPPEPEWWGDYMDFMYQKFRDEKIEREWNEHL